MAASNKQTTGSRHQVTASFCNGVQDNYLGTVENAVYNEVKDENAKNQKYFSIRPSFNTFNTDQVTTGTFLSANDDTIVTGENIYVIYKAGNSLIDIQPIYYDGGDNQGTYETAFGDGLTHTVPVTYNYTDSNASYTMVANPDSGELHVVETTYNKQGYIKQPYNFTDGTGLWTLTNVTVTDGNVISFDSTDAYLVTHMSDVETYEKNFTVVLYAYGTADTTVNVYLGSSSENYSVQTITLNATNTAYSLSFDSVTTDNPGVLYLRIGRTSSTTATSMTLNSFQVYPDYTPSSSYEAGDVQQLEFLPNPYMAVLDGYLFVAEKDTNTIYNCDLNDYTTWDTDTNLIRASQFPGIIMALSRINNYVVVLKDTSIEFFYDAAITDSSPLQRNTSYTKMVGLAVPSSLVAVNNVCFFIGTDSQGARKVYQLSETACEPISTQSIDNLLVTYKAADADYNVRAYYLAVGNKRFYCFTRDTSSTTDVLAYDMDEKVWAIWNGTMPCLMRYQCKDSNYLFKKPVVYGANPGSSKVGYRIYTANYGVDAHTTKDFVPTSTTGGTYEAIKMLLKVPPTDLGSTNRKFLNEIALSVFSPAAMEHTVTVYKLAGGNNITSTSQTTNRNDLKFHNWGQAINFQIQYECADTTANTVVGKTAYNYRAYGLDVEFTMGIS